MVEIEGLTEIMSIIGIAKLLHDIGRFDIVKKQFVDVLSYDTWTEDMWGVITSVFSGFNSGCNDEKEILIITDDLITDYFIHAWEYGKNTNTPPDKNPYVIEAENEARQYLNFTYNMDWKLLGYTKSKRAAGKSKLVIYACAEEFCEYDCLAYGLVYLYKWFKDKSASFAKEVKAE